MTSALIDELTRTARIHAIDPTAARLETEEARAMLSDWWCLSRGLHDRFHQELGIDP